MANGVLLHSVLGLRPTETALAQGLPVSRHPTTAPDFFGGRSTSDVTEGLAILDSEGDAEVLSRAREAAHAAPGEAVLVGISMGYGAADRLWGERPLASDPFLISGSGPIPDPLPSGAPVEMHMARPDPWDSEKVVAARAGDPRAQPLRVERMTASAYASGPVLDASSTCAARLLALLDAL